MRGIVESRESASPTNVRRVDGGRDAVARRLSAGELVGPIVSERRPTVGAATASLDGRTTGSGDVDLCRLLVAVLGVSVYLGAPASLLFYAALKIIG